MALDNKIQNYIFNMQYPVIYDVSPLTGRIVAALGDPAQKDLRAYFLSITPKTTPRTGVFQSGKNAYDSGTIKCACGMSIYAGDRSKTVSDQKHCHVQLGPSCKGFLWWTCHEMQASIAKKCVFVVRHARPACRDARHVCTRAVQPRRL